MKLKQIIDELGLKVITAAVSIDREVTGGYSGDILSEVIGNADEGNIWITVQTHQYIVTVAVMKSLSAIIFADGREPDIETVKKAEAEDVPILQSDIPAFNLVGKLFQMGIS